MPAKVKPFGHVGRTANACRRCREQKIKCSGTHPCVNCTKRQKQCVFDRMEPQVTVSKQYLSQLHTRLNVLEKSYKRSHPTRESDSRGQQRYGSLPSHDAADDSCESSELGDEPPHQNQERAGATKDPMRQVTSSQRDSVYEVAMTNPLSTEPNSWLVSDVGANISIYLGTSSNWSFSRRVLDGASKAVYGLPVSRDDFMLDGDVYDLSWSDLDSCDTDVKQSLPTIDHAKYLVMAVKFHLGDSYHLLDQQVFMTNMDEHFNVQNNEHKPSNLWYTHFLMILAFGKAFTTAKQTGRKFPGAVYFQHAMKLLPDSTQLWKDPFTAAEILCCAALYLQCLDFRYAAYLTIGQAVRTALFQGMHTEMPAQIISSPRVERARKIWWTVYRLDRELSSLMGLPIQLADENITAHYPSFDTPEQSTAFRLHIKMCRCIASIIGTVYGPDGRLDTKFLASTRSALTSIADIAGDLGHTFSLTIDSHFREPMSRVAASLQLSHHHCIILTTRPLMFSLFTRQLDSVKASPDITASVRRLRVLLKMCVDSAQYSLRVLTALGDQDLLQGFLPFDLEAAYTSSIIVLIASFIDPNLLDKTTPGLAEMCSLLDEFIAHGNQVAKRRKAELQQLSNMLGILRIGARETQDLREAGTDTGHEPSDPADVLHITDDMPGYVSNPTLAPEHPFAHWTFEYAMNSSQLMTVADFLDERSFDEVLATFNV